MVSMFSHTSVLCVGFVEFCPIMAKGNGISRWQRAPREADKELEGACMPPLADAEESWSVGSWVYYRSLKQDIQWLW